VIAAARRTTSTEDLEVSSPPLCILLGRSVGLFVCQSVRRALVLHVDFFSFILVALDLAHPMSLVSYCNKRPTPTLVVRQRVCRCLRLCVRCLYVHTAIASSRKPHRLPACLSVSGVL